MKTLAQEATLKTDFEKISISDFRARPGEVVAQVQLGKTYLVTHRGKSVAVVSKPPGQTLSIVVDAKGNQDFRP